MSKAFSGTALNSPIADADLVYCASFEALYGLSDDRRAYFTEKQVELRRFLVEPTSLCGDAKLRVIHTKRDHLASHDFEPTSSTSAFEEVRIDFVHSTARYEGNTMSVQEVSDLLHEDMVAPGRSMSEHLEVTDIAAGFDMVVRNVKEGKAFSVESLLELHGVAAAHLADCGAGEFRWDQRYVTGSPVLPPPPALCAPIVEALVSWYNDAPSFERACLFHLVFEDCHPFQDGNGRTGRLVLNQMLMSLGFPATALKVTEEATREYYRSIRAFTEDFDRRDGTSMVSLIADAVDEALSKPLLEIEQTSARR